MFSWMKQQTPMIPPFVIVMLSGWAGSGKDAAAALLVEEHNFARVAFADALKVDVSEATGLPVTLFHSWAKDSPLPEPIDAFPHARTPRDLLLAHAIEQRALNPDVFSQRVIDHIRERQWHQDRFVISDWRYRREYEHMSEEFPAANIVRVRVTRQDVQQMEDSTERDLDGVSMDLTIANDGCISDLRDALRHGLRPWLHRG